MPRPVYIVCSESSSDDKETGLLSIFNIIDKVQFSKNPAIGQRQVAPLVQLRITAGWMKEKGDDGSEFEFALVLRPPHKEDINIGSGTFSFTLPLFRVTAKLIGGLPLDGDGILWIECRVRKVGARGWQNRQEYPIFVEELPSPIETVQSKEVPQTSFADTLAQ